MTFKCIFFSPNFVSRSVSCPNYSSTDVFDSQVIGGLTEELQHHKTVNYKNIQQRPVQSKQRRCGFCVQRVWHRTEQPLFAVRAPAPLFRISQQHVDCRLAASAVGSATADAEKSGTDCVDALVTGCLCLRLRLRAVASFG